MIFNKYRLEDITDKIGDGIHGTPEYDDNGDFYFVNGNNLVYGDIAFKNDTKRINEEQYLKNKRNLNKNTLLVSINGTLGNVAKYNNEKIILGKSACYINVKDEYNVDYVYFVFESPKFKKYLQYGANGTTIKNVPLSAIRNYEISIPSKENQDKIVKILKSIEDKIKLNNKINNNLHDLCNNLYFKLVSQLNDTNSSVESIKNVAKCVLGGTPSRTKKEYWNGSINWINSGEINKFRIIKASEKITELGLNKSSTTLLPRGTTVLAITGATLGQVSRLEIDSCANQSVIGIITNKKELNNYMYLSILNSINDLVLKQTGGAQQHINKNDVETHEIIVPSTELISQFDEIIRPLFDQISVNCFEINKLEQLRDTLLPKLMNGEIDLDNIEI